MKTNSFSELLNILPKQSNDAILSVLSILPINLRDFLREKLEFIADPVFEPMFSYKPCKYTFEELGGKLLEKSLVDVLDTANEYKFEKNMYPYKHQVDAWETLLNTNNSLVVSSGTGSGKTECFMIPIISDLVKQIEENNAVLEGVQALFIYPLNALIQNQKERFSEWTRHYNGKIRFCLYNGLLPQNTKEKSLEEVVDRERLWESPSPLLITNTTMLEYMLIRANDKNIIDKSKGKLKYIVLDEAHTYIGSQAAELSLLLKRIMNAFEVEAKNVKFIATSATIGDVNADIQLKQFLSSISGVNEDNITVVFGKNEIETIIGQNNSKPLQELEKINNTDKVIEELRKNKFACSIRSFFISDNLDYGVARSLSEICEKFNLSKDDALRWLDLLSITPEKQRSFLPLRLHIFHSTFPGLWACCDPNCSCKDNIPEWKFGKIYFREQTKCKCGAPVFRIKACGNCGNVFLEAKISENIRTGQKYLQPVMLQNIDEFSLDSEENNIIDLEDQKVWVKNIENGDDTVCYLNKEDCLLSIKNKKGIRLNVFENSKDVCCCDNPKIETKNAFLPIKGAPFILNYVLPTLLNYAEISNTPDEKPHNGQKIICFTDSRQGTARLATQLQQNSERSTFRSILLHVVASIEDENKGNNNDKKINELEEICKKTKITLSPDTIKILKQKNTIIKEENIISEILKEFNGNDLKWIYTYYRSKDSVFDSDEGKENLIEILFARELLRRPKKSINIETLGLLATSYDFSKITDVPTVISKYFELNEWKDFLKIILDFYIRANGYVTYPKNWDKWGALKQRINEGLNFNDKWPKAEKKGRNRNIINLLFYALNLDKSNDYHIDIINEIMKEAWKALTIDTGILKPSTNQSYRMDMKKIGLMRPSKIYICPITNKALDVTLKDYSPYSTNKNTPKCKQYNFPIYDFNEENGKTLEECILIRRNWLLNNEYVLKLKKIGLWHNITDSIILGNRYFRTAEHSAQQTHEKLRQYEYDFKNGKVNVLNCSTTMEMGIDIGGITISSMNNVPPHPANYLQRAGRAGRRRETKAISFTLCKDNFHDQYVFSNPKWAFTTKINAPYVDRYSFIVLQRHINSLLLSYYFGSIRGQISDATKLNMEWLMLPLDNNKLNEFKKFSKNAIRSDETIKKSIKSIIKNTHYEDLSLDTFIAPLEKQVDNLQKEWGLEYSTIQEQKEKEKDKSISLKAIKKTEERLLGEYALKELVEYGLLPGYGFPTNIVTFDNSNRDNLNSPKSLVREDNMLKRRELPSRDINIALREYAPGSDVIIDGLVYKSAGITLNWHIPASESDVKEIQSIRYIWRCHKCGASGTFINSYDLRCDVCGEKIKTESIWKYIQPSGFAVDFNAKTHNDVSIQNFIKICEPLVTAHGTLNSYLGLPYIKYKNDKEGSVIHYSNGEGNGYVLCLECGRMDLNNKKNNEKFKNNHYKLRSSKKNNNSESFKIECRHSSYSIVESIKLGVEEKTDVLELILSDINKNPINDETLAYTLAVAIRSGISKYMNIEVEEIGCLVKKIKISGSNKIIYSIELFDENASGYCSSEDIIKNMNTILKYAQNLLKCDCAKSCNKCVLQNDTKYNYMYLDRKIALDFLTDEWIEKNTLAPNMKIFGDTTVIASYSIESLIEDTKNLKGLFIIVPDESEDEDFSSSPIYRIINRCNILNIKTILCINEDKLNSNTKLTIAVLSKLNNITVKNIPQGLNKNIMAILWDGIKYYAFASLDNEVKKLNQYWGSNINTSILSGYMDISNIEFSDIKLKNTNNNNYNETYEISCEANGDGNEFGLKLLEQLSPSLDGRILSPITKIEYKDRYIKNPLVLGLFYNFIKALKQRYLDKWDCKTITIETSKRIEEYEQIPTMYYHDWSDLKKRNDVLTTLFKKIDLDFDLKEKNKKYLEHSRTLTLEMKNGKTIKLIFDQGFSYWRCTPCSYSKNIFPFEADVDYQVSKLDKELPNITGDIYATKIFYTK